ncbi:hypothetical protein HQ346_24800 [Rhodococcus sp. BP-252]|uniref:hypothetical protein n=1 Tax=unclassified Rhodococcus (in: high G+C Gram-positive bacteria) TaxID=192944 RepID=UPI001C9A5E6C|nr:MULTISPECIES: hypothetical protein [unclassified Rhodococcus (in: high G+C Gram-positive bacteria)]MBY6414825.1 hypothetical protein [Rhodococcus sp. BP-320]MBY6419728.1 hypothetical protein [Rhodococcus sp. BP-321]MBY6424703.1 hypothetical protein [Rhodococcus sp. BP-324]MBY6429703.1 hypothetical protein [Rhodococcus sp. BP-323]MBY6434675.1 hypothetical protein [Rhodococcus sp. BP-322]
MESSEYIEAPELMSLYTDYKAALRDLALADMAVEKQYRDGPEMKRSADQRVEDALSDLDALEVNAFLASTLLADRFAIVTRLREQQVSWAKIGTILGISRQAAQQWHDYFHLRPRAENPTRQLRS